MKNYKIRQITNSKNEIRYIITDIYGYVLHDCNGYGFKTYTSVKAAAWYLMDGGKPKKDNRTYYQKRIDKKNKIS